MYGCVEGGGVSWESDPWRGHRGPRTVWSLPRGPVSAFLCLLSLPTTVEALWMITVVVVVVGWAWGGLRGWSHLSSRPT